MTGINRGYRMKSRYVALTLALVCTPAVAMAADTSSKQIIKQSQQYKGFINLFYNQKDGQLYLEASKFNQPFIMLTSLPQGLGSNDVGLDRGQLGHNRLVQFERQGPYLVLKQLNTAYRADSDNPAEQQSVKQAFADSVLWQGKIIDGKRPIVAINDLVINDLHGVVDALKASEQGAYQLDKQRSVIIPAQVKTFERNADVDVQLTFSAPESGNHVATVTPDGKHISLVMRYSFIALPEAGYQTRRYDPMSGFFFNDYLDYATAIDEPIKQHLLVRHHLQKEHPGIAPSDVVEPIVYYLDPGAPEPIRTALLDGARWWQQAFDHAGFINGFKVEMLPEDADPQDIRFNTIQWVHRATRGWSYGAAITDPRTGEIIKGHVTLGSQRVRQDHMIARGLTSGWSDRAAAEQASMDLALARIRQLAAHEIGHTLGIDHNFAASTNNNASVMDYPHPHITLNGEQIDISQPYKEGIGDWDTFAITYGYGDYGNEQLTAEQQQKLLSQLQQQGLRYISEADSRQADASHMYASLWDNGSDPVAELARLSQVRQVAIAQFSPQALLAGESTGELSDTFVPIYLLTRYQIAAAAKVLGGVDYNYFNDNQVWHYAAPELQQSALMTLAEQLDLDKLNVPEQQLQMLVPKTGNYRSDRESFASNLHVISDPLAMAEMLSRHITSQMLQPTRLNRIAQASSLDREQITIAAVLDEMIAKSLYLDPPNSAQLGTWKRLNSVVIEQMLAALHNPATSPEVKAQIHFKMEQLLKQLKRKQKRASRYLAAHYAWLAQAVAQGVSDKDYKVLTKPVPMPPGSPI